VLTGNEGADDETEWELVDETPDSSAPHPTGGNATRGMPEGGGLYGTGLAMIPGGIFTGVIGQISPSPQPPPPFEFINHGLIDNGGFNFYMALKYTGPQSQSWVVATTVTVAVDGRTEPLPAIGTIYTYLGLTAQRFPAVDSNRMYPQITPLGPYALQNYMDGIDRSTTSGTITVTIQYTPATFFTGLPGRLTPAHSSFFANEIGHNGLVGSSSPSGVNWNLATTEIITIGWGPNGVTLISNFPGGPNRTVSVGGPERETLGVIVTPIRPPYTGP
jgi:hypothetical protein